MSNNKRDENKTWLGRKQEFLNKPFTYLRTKKPERKKKEIVLVLDTLEAIFQNNSLCSYNITGANNYDNYFASKLDYFIRHHMVTQHCMKNVQHMNSFQKMANVCKRV